MKTNSQGYNKVYNGGVFFVNKGYIPVYDDFEAEENLGNAIPEITVDPINFTITVDYNKMHGQEMDWNARLAVVKEEKNDILESAIRHLTTLNVSTEDEIRALWNAISVNVSDEMSDDEKFETFEDAEHEVENFLSVTASRIYAATLDGAKVKMRTTRDARTAANPTYKYMQGQRSAQCNSNTSLTVQSVWQMEMDDDFGFKLHNLAFDQYVSMGTSDDNPANLVDGEGTTFNIVFNSSTVTYNDEGEEQLNGARPGFAALVVVNSGNGIHLHSNGNIISWEMTAGANQWSIELIDDADEQAFIDAAQARMATVTAALPSADNITSTRSYAGKTQYFGDQPSQFSLSAAAANYHAVKAAADALTAGEDMDYPNCYAATVFPTTNLYTLNPVEPGHFVRIKSWNYNEDSHVGYSFGMSHTNDMPCFWNNNDESIFYFMPSTPAGSQSNCGFLVSYLKGYAAKHYADASEYHENSNQTSIHLNARTNAAGNADLESCATKVWFANAAPLHMNRYYTEDRYYLNFYQGATTTVRYAYNAPANGSKQYSDGGASLSATTAAAYYTFAVEYVTELPVTIVNGIGSLICPMAVDLPSDGTATAYIAELDGHEISWHSATHIPANAHAIIYAPGQEKVNVNVSSTQDAWEAPEENEHLKGHHLTMQHAIGDDTKLFKLDPSAYNAPASAPALRVAAEAPELQAITLKKVDAGTAVVAPGTLLVNVTSVDYNDATELKLPLDGRSVNLNDVSTSISEISADGEGREVVYDLQGRRLTKPVKGAVNIVNGKKILVID